MIIKSSYSNNPVWRDINVHAVLPKELQPLEEISQNLWWVWNEEFKAVLEKLDPEEWEKGEKNPVFMLNNMKSDIKDKIIKDPGLMTRIQEVYEKFKKYMSEPLDKKRPSIAYFSMEDLFRWPRGISWGLLKRGK